MCWSVLSHPAYNYLYGQQYATNLDVTFSISYCIPAHIPKHLSPMVATLLIFVSMLVDVFSTIQNNSFTCFENGCICIPQSYDNLKDPSDNGTILYLDMNNAPENSITTLRKVDQKEFTLSLTWIWMISWTDERLNLTTKNAPFVPVTEAVENKLWTPYLEISPVKSIRKLPELHKQRPGLSRL